MTSPRPADDQRPVARLNRAAPPWVSLLTLAVMLLAGTDAAAQAVPADPPADNSDAADSPRPVGGAAEPTIGFSADTVDYDDSNDIVTAAGNVELQREAWRLRADQVVWNRKTGAVVATGNVALTSPQGDIAYGDSVELTETLRDGMVANLLVVLDSGGRLAARSGTRLANGDMQLDHATYSPCAVENAQGCPISPSWQIRATRVFYDRARGRVRYYGARIELFGLPLVPLPGLSHPAGTPAGSGFLVPNARVDRVNGFELAVPYYIRYSDRLDLTLTPHVYSNVVPMAEAQIRGLTGHGAWQAHGYATYSSRVPLTSPGATGQNDFRGYLEATGGFQFSPAWSLSASARITTDRTFLRRYDITRDDRLRSGFTLARSGPTSYLSIAGWATQTLRVGDSQSQQPIALPAIDYRKRIDDPLLGGIVEIEGNSLALLRTGGQDTQRLFASAQWDWRRITPLGQEIHLTALGRGDVYHSSDSLATPTPAYRGADGWQTRAFAAGAVEVRWPFIGQFADGIVRITPRVQFVATSPVNNVDIPNEDSRAFELEDSNVFAINRFPGNDRFEDGSRVTYGVEWAYSRPGLSITTQVAQSYRIGGATPEFPIGTGLTERASDIVGRTTVAYQNFIRLTHRFRLDKDNLAIRRNEFDATVGTRQTYALVGYFRLNRDIASLGEDLRDREELRLGGRIQIARYWSVFGSTIIDLTSRSEDPASLSDGYQPVRHRVGVTYEDDCVTVGFTWRRDYQDTGDARAGNTFLLRLAFRNLGV